MSNKSDNTAFPCPPGPDDEIGSTGMSLREWYAGQALPGVIQMATLVAVESAKAGLADKEFSDAQFDPHKWAHAAIEVADAMMKKLGYD